MANDEHVEIVKKGADAIAEWREANPDVLLDLFEANLELADLQQANLAGANLELANLQQANLAGANLAGVAFYMTDLTEANLRGAYLGGVMLHGAYVSSATLAEALLHNTSFDDVDLSDVHGLDEIAHNLPSGITTSTLIRTAAGLATDPANQPAVETFFRGAGLDDDTIEWFRSRIGRPIEFYTCFISYSHADKSFAERLYAQLQARGVRPFKDDKDIKIGDEIRDVVNRQIRMKDKVILCCSESPLNSQWVKDELDIAFEKEADGSRVILPLNLDGYLFDGWEDGRGAKVRTRLAANFHGWDTDNAVFESELERVIEALRAG